MPGPPAKTNPVRRNARVGTRKLPAEGRRGKPPTWPLSGPAPSERAIWVDLWKTPQAAAWEELGWNRTVARYARLLTVAESLDKDALSEARQLEDRLGLTPKSMRMLLWEIVADEVAEKREASSSGDVRKRVRAVG